VAAAFGPEVQTAQGRAFPARMARLTLRPGRSSQFTPRFSERKRSSRNGPFHARISLFGLAAYRLLSRGLIRPTETRPAQIGLKRPLSSLATNWTACLASPRLARYAST
jgi:hypothetical protein